MPEQLPHPWTDWYFEDEYLKSPNGDTFTPHQVLACLFVRQLETYSQVLYGNWKQTLIDPEH